MNNLLFKPFTTFSAEFKERYYLKMSVLSFNGTCNHFKSQYDH